MQGNFFFGESRSPWTCSMFVENSTRWIRIFAGSVHKLHKTKWYLQIRKSMDDKKIQSKLRGNPEIAAVWSGVSLECKGMIPNCAEHYCLETSPKRSKIVSVIKKIALTSEIIRHPILTSLHDVARTQYIYECCFKAQSSKLERLFSLKRGKRDVRALSFELSKMSPQVGLAVHV